VEILDEESEEKEEKKEKVEKEELVKNQARLPVLQRFFKEYYVPFMTFEVNGFMPVAFSFVVVILGWSVFAFISASKLEPPHEPEEWFKPQHMWYKIGHLLAYTFLASSEDNYVKVSVIWGIRDPYVDRSNYKWNLPCYDRGTPVWDPNFDLGTTAAQQDILDACALIRTFPCSEAGCSNGLISFGGSTKCFMEEFQTWYLAKHGSAYSPGDLTGTSFFDELKLAQIDWENTPATSEYAKDVGFVGG